LLIFLVNVLWLLLTDFNVELFDGGNGGGGGGLLVLFL
jgi:hypothetical protein